MIPLSSPIGGGSLTQKTCTASSPCTAAALAAADLYDWEQVLLGASEKTAANESVGGLVTPRACVEDLGNSEYQITIAWRGTQEVPDSDTGTNACGEGAGNYGAADEYRRFISIRFFATK